MTHDTPILATRDLSVHFGGVKALDMVDFEVRPGSVTSVIGPNGAGKTTLFNAVTGLVHTTAGRLYFEGRDISRKATHVRAGRGIVRSFQNLEIFSNMSILENVMTGAHGRIGYSFGSALFKLPGFFRGEAECRRIARESLEFVGLNEDPDGPATDLPFGKQRLLEMARAIAAGPKLLLLDEPAAGLNNRETAALGQLIRRIRNELEITIALVEHDMDLIMDISDQIMVLCFGKVLATGTPAEVQSNPEVVAAYLGGDDDGCACLPDEKSVQGS